MFKRILSDFYFKNKYWDPFKSTDRKSGVESSNHDLTYPLLFKTTDFPLDVLTSEKSNVYYISSNEIHKSSQAS